MTETASIPAKAEDLHARLTHDWQDVKRITRGIEKPVFKMLLLEPLLERRTGGIFGRREQVRLKQPAR